VEDEEFDETAEDFEDSDEGVSDDDLDDAEADDQEEPDDSDEDEEEEAGATPASTGDDDSGDGEEPPPKTGDRKTDGVAKGQWAVRQRARKAEKENADLRSELSYLRGRVEAMVPPTAAAPAVEEELPEIDFTDMHSGVDSRVGELLRRQDTKRQTARAKADEQAWQSRLQTSVADALEDFEDFQEVSDRFIARQDTTKGLGERVRAHPDPARWAYENQKRFEARAAKSDPDKDELLARIADLESKQSGGKKPPGPRSLSRARGAGKRSGAKSGPKSRSEKFSAVFN
jgi:hypothetical protein